MNKNLLEKSLIIDYLKEYEYFCFGKADNRSYLEKQMKRAEKLWEMCPENQLYHLMQAAVDSCWKKRGRRKHSEEI